MKASSRAELSSPSPLAALFTAACLLERGLHTEARHALEQVPPSDLKTELFRRALRTRLDGATNAGIENLYLRKFAFRQIDLFDLMAAKLPLIQLSAEAANDALAFELGLMDQPTLIDIGIGSGRQELELLSRMASRAPAPHGLRIIGIEPSAESLRAAERALGRRAEALGIPLEFVPIHGCIETLDAEQWRKVRALASGPGQRPVVNEAFALHHVKQGKDTVLARIAELEPATLVLTEPDSDHDSPRLSVRFLNAWRHYGLVFDVIDRIGVTPDEAEAMKTLFFYREIEDILAGSETERSERHETAGMWLERLKRAGFRPRHELATYDERPSDGVFRSWRGEFLELRFRESPVVSVISASV